MAAAASATLSDQQSAALERYLDLLLAGNERMNLTRITDREQARVQHIGDALTLLAHLPAEPHRLADLGSGGGVPGIPLAIMRPDVAVTLIESVGKKAGFLAETAAALELPNVTVWHGRAEEWKQQQFDVVTCRAVATMGKILDWSRPLVAPGGKLLAMKGPKITGELTEASPILRRQGAQVHVHPVGAEALAGRVIAQVRWGKMIGSPNRPPTRA